LKLCSICRSSLEVLVITSKIKLPIESHILCADVTSLYPSIPIEFGLKAVKYMLHCYNMPEIDFHMSLLNWVLTNNYFTYNNEYYHQIYGTAMGTPVAVEYANTVMFYIEHTLIDKYKPILYLRYIDDIFAILPTIEICKKFIIEFNNQCSNIQLESVTIAKSGIFLDLDLEINCDNIISKVYQKPSNKYLYLPPTTNHQSSVMLNVIKQELRRYCLYTSKRSDELVIKEKFYERLCLRGHLKTYLDPLFQPTLERDVLLMELQNSVIGKKGLYKQSMRLYIIVLLPKLDQPLSLRDFFRLPPEVTSHPYFIKVYGELPLVIGRQTFKNIGRLLTFKPIKPSKPTNP